MEMVDIYQPYIEKLSMRVAMDENGHCREMVDETVKKKSGSWIDCSNYEISSVYLKKRRHDKKIRFF